MFLHHEKTVPERPGYAWRRTIPDARVFLIPLGKNDDLHRLAPAALQYYSSIFLYFYRIDKQPKIEPWKYTQKEGV